MHIFDERAAEIFIAAESKLFWQQTTRIIERLAKGAVAEKLTGDTNRQEEENSVNLSQH